MGAMSRNLCCRTLTVLNLTSAFAAAQPHQTWRDLSPHRVQMVALADDVQVEVLDWGGEGRPLVLLAGYLTAHAYDALGPKLTEFAHVYGITRRGLGASSRADAGYTARESADDVVGVLNKLNLAGPVIVGHSFGGQDLSTIGADYPNRIAGLVYLNSAEDPKLEPSAFGSTPPNPKRLPAAMQNPPPPDRRSFAAYRAWQIRAHGVAFPESELRWLYKENPDGSLGEYQVAKSVRDALFAGLRKPEYSRIRVPVLAFFATPPDAQELIRRYTPASPDERAAIEQKRSFDLAVALRHVQDLQKGVPKARIVELPGANFYVFLSNEADLLREMRSFITALP
jgi:pimeloyl-ACP methyl ester carboxylesterase